MTPIQILISEPDGSYRFEQISPNLESLQKLVGGYIEAVSGDSWHLYVNEEGKLNGLPVNKASTILVDRLRPGFARHDVLVGTVLWMGNGIGGAEGRVPRNVVDLFSEIAAGRGAERKGLLTVIRWKNDIWVFDTTNVDTAAKVRSLAVKAREAEEHGTIEVYSHVTPGKWQEIRVDIMDDFRITLHDERADRSYG